MSAPVNAGDPHPAALDEKALLAECACRRQRRSGPGGQHRNKVETGIFLKHLPTGTEASATERRSQDANRRMAIERLRMRLAVDVRSPVATEQSPSALWSARVTKGRLNLSANHADFAPLLAEALNFIAAEQFDHTAAAERLECTPSQLVKLLRKHPRALVELNLRRQARGMSRLS